MLDKLLGLVELLFEVYIYALHQGALLGQTADDFGQLEELLEARLDALADLLEHNFAVFLGYLCYL